MLHNMKYSVQRSIFVVVFKKRKLPNLKEIEDQMKEWIAKVHLSQEEYEHSNYPRDDDIEHDEGQTP